MSKIAIKKQAREWQPEYADVLRGGEYIACELDEKAIAENEIVFLPSICPHTWSALGKVGVDPVKISRTFEYSCPWSKNKYYHFMPIMILAEKNEIYRKAGGGNFDMALDSSFIRDSYFHTFSKIEPGPVMASLRGHGYTTGTSPYDGSGSWRLRCMELTNGDMLAGWLWEWSNK